MIVISVKLEEHSFSPKCSSVMKTPLEYEAFEAKLTELTELLKNNLDLKSTEQELLFAMQELIAPSIKESIQDILNDVNVLFILTHIASLKGMRFSGFRNINIRLLGSITVRISSPYFYLERKKKKGRKKKGRKKGNNLEAHLGLCLMGFVGIYSPYIVQEVVSTSVSVSSFSVAKTLLESRGINLCVNTIEKICVNMALLGFQNRGAVSLEGNENFESLTLVIGTDGGRIRERRNKKGRKSKNAKQQGYYTDWKEPKLLAIYLLDKNGEKVKSFPPIYDATMGNHIDTFILINEYLKELPLYELRNIVFCGDGAPWIWQGVEQLFEELKDLKITFYQVLDYTHAKQALKLIWDLLPKKMSFKEKNKLWEIWKNELWNGNIDTIKELIKKSLSKRNQKKGLKKWTDYFKKNEHRMQYSTFKENKIICGSGCVESAIRRVINLRLKAPGSFWKKENAECFLFLRAQVISGRFKIFQNNIRLRFCRDFKNINLEISKIENDLGAVA